MPTKWTPEEDALIQKLREEGFTAREIALRVKRSDGAIRARFSTLKILKNKSWSAEDKQQLLYLRDTEKWPIRKLAAHFDVSVRAIEGMLATVRSNTDAGKNNS
jgi:DNA-directed RNA polymerase specialized sigma24 family protein